MNADYELTLNDYLAVVRRRAWLIAASFLSILSAGLLVALLIPPVYESTGTILVESQQIPTDLVAVNNNTYADERIEIIRQRVMTRENLLRIIDKYRLFADQGKQLTVSEKIDEMREAIVVTLVNAEVKGRGKATIAFRLSFEHRQPEVANRVANELVTLFLDENVKQRTERASETTEFLTQEANKLKSELETLEDQLAAFKQEHGNALPEHQELRMGMLARSEAELKEIDRDYKSALEELRFLDLELAAAKAGVVPAGTTGVGESPQDLASLKAEHARLLSKYTAAHPDVRALERKIKDLQAATDTGELPAAAGGLEVARVEAKIAALQARADSLSAQKISLQKRVEGYEQQILQTPQVERGLITLMRDHQNAQRKYEEIRTKQMSARISENLEQENKAERFVLLEPPLMPEKPVKPNRKKVAALAVFLALAGAAGLVMLLESLSQRVRGVDALANLLGRRVLATIPYIPTQAELARQRTWQLRGLVGASVLAVTLLVSVHLLYMPLDLLLFKALARFE